MQLTKGWPGLWSLLERETLLKQCAMEEVQGQQYLNVHVDYSEYAFYVVRLGRGIVIIEL